ncbi:MAG: hypothetical protein FWF59_05975 [Turicibacter sp.]|nr:hypothetical protein [Turicibacter sp.]
MSKIYGHRGSKGTHPENTLQSFEAALLAGAVGLELDIHLSLDGELIVIHDETMDRTTQGKGGIKDLTLAQIKEMDASVPTLGEVLELLKGRDTELNIELKTTEVAYDGIEEKVLQAMKGETRKVVYSSFNLPTIRRIKRMDPNAQIAWLLFGLITQPKDYMEEFNLESLHVDKDLVLKYPHHWQGLYDKIRVWTANDMAEIAKLKALGVEAIITDYPEEARHV